MGNQYTVGYIQDKDKYLFLFRNKKEQDINKGKWIGIGGRIEENETPDACMDRETFEETGYTVLEKKLYGQVIYKQVDGYVEHMYVYLITKVEGERKSECNEGEFGWMTMEEFLAAPHWEGDELWLRKVLRGETFGVLENVYDGNTLISYQWK